ncbi:cytochrome c biogenesis protein CcsA [Thermoflexibacter ruber]|uniref:cytochrome c biogenesis protein CcsA n=1 Tax=Thermoflexibacter ruber TaxID=1003 RepID=UPI000B87DD1F|nr:cytochrome c biogenesis protein CcsA [Thermoflexibacter ruber]
MFKNWWKILAVVLLFYTIIGGLLFEAPRLAILNETIRNLHFHVPMWFGMQILLTVSVVFSIRYLRKSSFNNDTWAVESANMAIVFGILGILTGMEWAKFTWGSPWSGDPKQNAAAIALLIYFAYLLLRNSFEDRQQKGRISAIYNIFAFATYIPLIYILPRLTDSLHPGNGGNPGFNAYDLDSRLRLVFYPAVVGWTLLGVWITTLRVRLRKVEESVAEQENEPSLLESL